MTPASPPAQERVSPKASAPRHPSLSPPESAEPQVTEGSGKVTVPAPVRCWDSLVLPSAENPRGLRGPLTSDVVNGAELRGWTGEPEIVSWRAERGRVRGAQGVPPSRDGHGRLPRQCSPFSAAWGLPELIQRHIQGTPGH